MHCWWMLIVDARKRQSTYTKHTIIFHFMVVINILLKNWTILKQKQQTLLFSHFITKSAGLCVFVFIYVGTSFVTEHISILFILINYFTGYFSKIFQIRLTPQSCFFGLNYVSWSNLVVILIMPCREIKFQLQYSCQ